MTPNALSEPLEHGREFRLLGPPGTGKTRWLAGRIQATVQARGAENVVVASFTRAAAAEIGGRGITIPKGQIGTLHSLAYATIDRPPVFAEQVEEWNKTHPSLALSVRPGSGASLDEAAVEWTGATPGDVVAAQLDNCRARLLPRDRWPRDVAEFETRWAEWKRGAGVVDFTDMIEMAAQDGSPAPGNPEVMFIDEVQDLTPQQLLLVRAWGEFTERLIIAGDPNQAVYGFAGASPEAFLHPPLPESDEHVLAQSWRIPATVHGAAERWIRGQSQMRPLTYLPRDEPGLVRHAPLCFSNPQALAVDVQRSLELEFTDAHGAVRPASVMVMAACAYMIDPLKHELRRLGLPFSNPWRRSRGDWNPMGGSGRGVSSRERLIAYLQVADAMPGGRFWTGRDVQAFSHVLKVSGCMTKGARAAIAGLPLNALTFGQVAELFADDIELETATTGEVEWFAANLLASARAGMEFPLQVARRRGPAALVEEPRLFIGTIHSFKGSEADVCYVLPDLSQRGAVEWESGGLRRDEVIRQFYVAMTRPRHQLVVCSPSQGLFVSPERMIAGARPGAA